MNALLLSIPINPTNPKILFILTMQHQSYTNNAMRTILTPYEPINAMLTTLNQSMLCLQPYARMNQSMLCLQRYARMNQSMLCLQSYARMNRRAYHSALAGSNSGKFRLCNNPLKFFFRIGGLELLLGFLV